MNLAGGWSPVYSKLFLGQQLEGSLILWRGRLSPDEQSLTALAIPHFTMLGLQFALIENPLWIKKGKRKKKEREKIKRKKRQILIEEKNGFLYASSSLVLFRSFSRSPYGELQLARIHSAEDSRWHQVMCRTSAFQLCETCSQDSTALKEVFMPAVMCFSFLLFVWVLFY